MNLKYFATDLNDLKNCLKKYKELIDKREIFKNEEYALSFIKVEGNLETASDENEFFSYAISFPELENDIKEVFESAVNFSRELNNSSYMWLDDESPFVLNALYEFVNKYPKYGYLLGSFIIPYWDNEHMGGGLYFLSEWATKFRVTKDTIKAFCYCDNASARQLMCGYDSYNDMFNDKTTFNLLINFRDNPDNYELFKEILKERFLDSPYVQTYDDESNYNFNPIEDIVYDMLYQVYPFDYYDDNFDREMWKTNLFVNKSAIEEIRDLTNIVEEYLGKTIIPSAEEYINKRRELKKAKKEAIKEEQLKEIDEEEKWQELIVKVFSNGEEIWDYVMTGTNPEVLKTISAIDIIDEGFKKGTVLGIELKDNFDVEGEDCILSSFKCFGKTRSSKVKNLIFTEENEVLRLYDVIYRILGNRISKKAKDILQTFSILVENEYFKRYKMSLKDNFSDLMLMVEAHIKNNLKSYKLKPIGSFLGILYDELMANDEIQELFLNYSFAREEQKLLIASWILRENQKNNVDDNFSTSLKEYIKENIEKRIFFVLKKQAKWPTEYQEKELWTPMKNYLTNGKFKNYSYENSFTHALAHLKLNLNINEDETINVEQNYYNILRDKESLIILSTAYILHDVVGIKQEKLISRFLKLMLNLAPLKMISVLKIVDEGLSDVLNIDSFEKSLTNLRTVGLSEKAYWIILFTKLAKDINLDEIDDLNILHSNQLDKAVLRYIQLLNIYNLQINIFADKKDALMMFYDECNEIQEHLEKGLSIIDEKYEYQFLKDLKIIQGETASYKIKIENLAKKSFLIEFRKQLYGFYGFFKNYLKANNVEYQDEFIWLSHGELEQDILDSLGAKDITLEEYHYLEKEYKSSLKKGYEFDLVISKRLKTPIYNSEQLNYLKKAISQGEEVQEGSIRIIYLSENCNPSHEEICVMFDKNGYSTIIMNRIKSILLGKRIATGDDAKFWKYAFSSYESFGRARYHSVDITQFFTELDINLQKSILSIISLISPEYLFKYIKKHESFYLKLLIDENINIESVFNYTIQYDKTFYLKILLNKYDCREIIENSNVKTLIKILEYIKEIPHYMPLIIKFKEHPHITVREFCNKVIINDSASEKEEALYKIVDSGIYGTKKVNGKIVDYFCSSKCENIKVALGMYIGLRFTATYPNSVPKIFNHKVVVKHPCLSKTTRTIIENTLKWNQSGYSDSNIFLGWHFETDEELISGEYKFAVYSEEDEFILEKTLFVEKG